VASVFCWPGGEGGSVPFQWASGDLEEGGRDLALVPLGATAGRGEISAGNRLAPPALKSTGI
jgi:hypothetical protein